MASFSPVDLIPGVAAVRHFKDATNYLGITNPAPPDLSKTPDAQALRDFAAMQRGRYENYQAPSAPRIATPGADQVGNDAQQMAYNQALQAAQGNAPSAAQQLMRKGIDEAAQGQLGIAATLQGSQPGFALRAGLQGAQRAYGAAAADAAALRANEMATARNELIGAANDWRSQNLAERGQNIDISKANAANQLTNLGLSNQYQLGMGNLAETSLLAPYNAMLANQQLQLQNQNANSTALGNIYSSAAKGIAASDRRLKEDIHPAAQAADDFLESLKPKRFRYRSPIDGPSGEQLGVIAQDLHGGVVAGPDGKKYISADVIGRVLAGLGRLTERIDDLKGGGR